MGYGEVNLSFFEEKHRDAICGYELNEKQRDFTAHPSEALARFKDNEYTNPIVMLNGNIPVGFFVLHFGADALNDRDLERMMLVRSFSVNPQYQGKGFGMQAMKQLPSFVKKHYPTIYELFLLVNLSNDRAEYIYKKAGYEDRGLRREGPKGPQKVFHYSLHN